MKEKVLTVIQETEILGKKIQMYGSVEVPLFKATDVAEWIEHSKVSMMLKSVDENEKVKVNNVYPENRTGGSGTWMLTEDGLYEVCMQSRKPIAKEMKKEIKTYLKSIRITGAAIQEGREEEMVAKYFPSFSKDVQTEMVNDLLKQNKALKVENERLTEFYDDLINTKGCMSINTCSKELGIGEIKLFQFLRTHNVFFYDNNGINIPYQRFVNDGKFVVKEKPCKDGITRPTTYATKKGLEYMRNLLKRENYPTLSVDFA